jgi:hypothetical protein
MLWFFFLLDMFANPKYELLRNIFLLSSPSGDMKSDFTTLRIAPFY